MNDVLDSIERQLMGAVERQVTRRRTRRRVLLVTALLVGLLALASLASAMSGFGPAAGLFAADEAIPPYHQPEPGGRLAALHAGGRDAAGWDLLVYRAEPPRLMAGRVRPYCLALARSNAKPPRRGGVQGPGEVYGGSTHCEYPPTMAARLLGSEMELGADGGGASSPDGRVPPTTPYYGLVLADATRITVTREHDRPVDAHLSRPFRLVIPRLSAARRRQIETPRQMRRTAGLPRAIKVRAFIAALETIPPEVGKRLPDVTVTATFENGHTRARVRKGHVVRPLPEPRAPEEEFGMPKVRLEQAGPDGLRWEAVGLESKRGLVSAAASKGRWSFRNRSASSSGASGLALLMGLTERAITVDQATGLPDGKRPRSSYAMYGLARGDTRSIVFGRDGAPSVRAKLSRVFTTVRRDEREVRSIARARERRRARGLPRSMRVRLYVAVLPRTAMGLRPRVTLAGGRVVRPFR